MPGQVTLTQPPSQSTGSSRPLGVAADTAVGRGSLHRWWVGGAFAIAMVVVFLMLGAIGAREADRGERVLSLFAPTVTWIRDAGKASCEWFLSHSQYVGRAVS